MRKKMRLYPGLLFTVLLLTAGGASPVRGQEDVYLRLALERDVFEQGDQVRVTFTVINPTGSDVEVIFGGCQRTPFALSIFDEQFHLIFDTGDCPGCVCAADLAFISFPPGEFTYPTPLQWNQVRTLQCIPPHPLQDSLGEGPACGTRLEAGVGVGTYYLLGRIYDREVYSDFVEIRIQRS